MQSEPLLLAEIIDGIAVIERFALGIDDSGLFVDDQALLKERMVEQFGQSK